MGKLILNGVEYGGNSKELTYAEYLALSTAEKNNGTIYFVTDAPTVRGGGGMNFSTTEQVIGYWVTGKPLYQITVPTGGSVPSGATLIQTITQTGYDTLLYTKTTD